MSSSSKSSRDYLRKHQRAILEPWRQSHNLPPSPPSPPPNRTLPTFPITTNSLSPPSPPHNSTQNRLNPPYKFKWTEKTVPVAEGNSETTTEGYMENYKNVSQNIRDQLNAKAKVVQIILTGIDNDIYFTVDACPNACEIWKAIERLKQGESINVQDLETNLYWEF
ncbi:hypothetical protein Tco_0152858 [Tanacetum coccineum]